MSNLYGTGDYAEAPMSSADYDRELLRTVAAALRIHRSDLKNWTVERFRDEASEAIRILEGIIETNQRHLDALGGLVLRLRRAPGGTRYIGQALNLEAASK